MVKVKKVVAKILHKILPGNSPDFLIVGAQKAGTTSLHYYLNQHPKLIGSKPKEVGFFSRDGHYQKGRKWYESAFKDISNPFKKGMYFEATPEYMYRSFSAERIYNYNPNIKIIILLRDPVKRAYSSWNMYRDFSVRPQGLPKVFYDGFLKGRESDILKEFYKRDHFPTFEEVFESELKKIEEKSDIEEPGVIRRGIYLPQIKRFHQLFGKDQVLILGFKDLINKKVSTLNTVLNFLGIEDSTWDFLNDEEKNVRTYPQKIGKELEDKLIEFYNPYNKELFDYLGTKINW